MTAHEVFTHLDNELDTHKRRVTQALNQYAYKGRAVMFQILPMREAAPGMITGTYVDYNIRPRIIVENLLTRKKRYCTPDNIIEWGEDETQQTLNEKTKGGDNQ